MQLNPQLKQAMSLWAEAQYAYSVKQWNTAHGLYARVLHIYEELHDFHAAHRTIYQLCLVAKQQRNASSMADYATALLEFNPPLSSIEECWLLLGQAERLRNHTTHARRALAESVRLSEARMTILLHDREPEPFNRWYPNEACIYAKALHEWGLLEVDVGKTTEAIRLIAFGELILTQALESFTASPIASAVYIENKLSEVILLRGLMAYDREYLENKML
jgi:hypothetical protein